LVSGAPPGLWLRWSLRDLRGRWAVVAATALVLAVGTGLAAALSSAKPWRVQSADASFSSLRAHDLRLTLSGGARVREGALRRVVGTALGRDVAAVQERLVVPTEIDASGAGRDALAPGRLVGVDVGLGRRMIDGIAITRGRGLRPGDSGRPVAVLETSFAEHYGLPASTTLRLPGGRRVRAVGQGRSPEWFIVAQPGAAWGGEASYAVAFVPLRTAQALAGAHGAVDEAVVRLVAGADVVSAQRRLERRLGAARLAGDVVRLDEESSHRLLYRDAENDQKTYDVFALLLLGAAAIAAFNLVSRVVDAQRRELGIGMALGVPPRALALRPLLLGAEIAVLGTALGVAMGNAAAAALRPVLGDLLPLPVLRTPMQYGLFARAGAIGLLLPLAAAGVPVLRAVRVAPIEAIRVGARAARGGGLNPLLRRVRAPGSSLAQLPLRNVLRGPRRAALTVAATGAIVAVVAALGGMVDSFRSTIDRAQAEQGRITPDRLLVQLDGYHRAGDATLRAIAALDGVRRVESLVRTDVELRAGREAIPATLTLVGSDARVWRPSLLEGTRPTAAGGVLLARRAADQLGIGVGDTIVVRHPVRLASGSYVLHDTRARVTGLHRDPFRQAVYADPGWARRLGLQGRVDLLQVAPRRPARPGAVQRSLLAVPGVASAQRATAVPDAFDDAMSAFSGVLRVGWYAALLLALLMAFNVATVTADERSREHATMFAFGVRPRRIVGLAMCEYVLLGVGASLLGLVAGRLIVAWIARALITDTLPEIGVLVHLSSSSLLAAGVAGVVAIGLGPLFTVRRLRRMDVPSTLRVVE
jgi:putative ABC transport system permease protein